MHVVVLGISGFVGSVLRVALRRAEHGVTGVARAPDDAGDVAADLSRAGVATDVLRGLRPDAVVNLAALPDIAPCRADPALARRVNAELPGEVAAACVALGARFVHVSTDQVFDGTRGALREDDVPAPIHVYGETKLAGERAARAGDPGALVLRPSLVTGLAPEGRRSSTSALREALAQAARGAAEGPRAFTDELRTPVAVDDLVRALVELCARRDVSGLLHCGGDEVVSRFELARREALRAGFDPGLVGRSTRVEARLDAERPRDLSLDSARLVALLGWTPRLFGD